MSKKLYLPDTLDYSESDLTAPDKVVEEILAQLPELTQNIVSGSIVKYDGPVTSYTTARASLADALAAVTTVSKEERVDIQKSLGKFGEEERKFECFLYTAGFTKYKYRMFFMKYGIANYPVQFTLEESICRSIDLGKYIVTCNNRDEVEDLIDEILKSDKILGVMQELIRIYQVKKSEGSVDVVDTSANVE